MSRRLDWNSDGANWPNREHSRFVEAGGLKWHVQVMGEGPVLLLLHGTGASTHSFRDLAPLLAKHFTVVMPDLPGHGFTSDGGFGKLSLDGMALALGELLRTLGKRPALGVGHSAGAAVLLRMDIDELISPELIVSINGALQPFGGLAGQVFAPIARVLALMPVVPGIFAWRASDPNVVDDLLKRTGSKLDPDGVAQYRLLAKNAAHVGAALGMMASWDLPGLKRDFRKVRARVLLIAGALDQMVPPADGATTQGDIPGSQLVRLKGLGHLAHEEQPGLFARLIEDAFTARPLQLSAAEGRDMGAPSDAPSFLTSHNPTRGPRALASGTKP
ncbi:MAG: alpha/beta fold hydrolase BchO [Bosea sp. (in: a-proteobacteria)]